MSGINEMELTYRNKINNVINGNETLKHYSNFIDSLSCRTQYTYTCIVSAFLKKINKKETDLTFDDFNDYMSDIKYLDNKHTKTSSYLITVYSALKKFSEYLYASKRIPENFMQNIKRPKSVEMQKTIQKRENGFLTETEIKQIVNNIYLDPSEKRELSDVWKSRNCAIIHLFLFTGMRCSALASIDLSDVDFERKVLFVTDKGSKVRKFDLPDKLLYVLSDWITERNSIPGIENEALFISNRKQRISNQAIALMVKTYSKKCGIQDKNITPHKLRATYGTQLYNVTKDIEFVRDCMGHNSANTTKLYIRGDRKNTKKAADIISSII